MKVTFELEEKELSVLISLMSGHEAQLGNLGKEMMPYWESDNHAIGKMEIAGHKERVKLAEELTNKLIRLHMDKFYVDEESVHEWECRMGF